MKPYIYNLNTQESNILYGKEKEKEITKWSIYSKNQRCRVNQIGGFR